MSHFVSSCEAEDGSRALWVQGKSSTTGLHAESLSFLVSFGNLYLLGRRNLGGDGEEKEYDQNIVLKI